MNNVTHSKPSKEYLELIDSLKQFAEAAERFGFCVGSCSYGTTSSPSVSGFTGHTTSNTATMDNAGYWQHIEPAKQEAPPANPEQFIEQQKQRIAQQKGMQRKSRIKPWDDKGKRFK